MVTTICQNFTILYSKLNNLIENTRFPTDCLLVSIDVSSLYTNIPHDEGIQSILKFLTDKSLSYKYPKQPNPHVIAELANIVLKNVFEFDEDFYLQKQGTAMGTKMAPAYANLFMGTIETKLTHKNIREWKRYIDDVFIIWTGSQAQLEHYIDIIN